MVPLMADARSRAADAKCARIYAEFPSRRPGSAIACNMATREHRLSEFDQGPPPLGRPLQLLAEDHNGTYLLPFRCEWRDDAWYAQGKTTALEARVLGWREWR